MSRSGRARDAGTILVKGGDAVFVSVEDTEGVRRLREQEYTSPAERWEDSPLLVKLAAGPDPYVAADFARRRDALLPVDPFVLAETEEGLDHLEALDRLAKRVRGYSERWHSDDEVEAAFVVVERTRAVLATSQKRRAA